MSTQVKGVDKLNSLEALALCQVPDLSVLGSTMCGGLGQ